MAIAGYDTIGGAFDVDGGNDGQLSGPYTVGAGSTITEFWGYIDPTAATQGRAVIYADNAGEPDALISTLAEWNFADGTPPEGWQSKTGLSIAVSVDAIWLGIWFFDSDLRYYYDTPGGTPGRYKSGLATYHATNPAPDPWPAGSDTTSTQKQSFYVVYTPGSAAQVLAPNADSVDGAWTNEAGNNTNLFESINEGTASDTDYIRSELGPSNSACRVKLAAGGDPASSTGHIIHWRAGKDTTGGATIGMTVKLYQGGGNSIGGGTLIASFTRSNVDAFTTYDETLSSGEADSITNYTDLYLEFSANQT